VVSVGKDAVCSYEIQVPPAKAWWCFRGEDAVCSYEIDVPPLKAGGVSDNLSHSIDAKSKLVIKRNDLGPTIRESPGLEK